MSDMKAACILRGGPDYRILINGKVYLFEDHPYYGPMPINKRGDERTLSPRHFFWKAVTYWYEQGKKVDGDGLCQWNVPPEITVPKIEEEGNAEIRRVMVERYGQERYLMDSGARAIHADNYGTLYRKEMSGDEPIVMVKVLNSTPEPDGSQHTYWLRVPPDIRTAHAAVAWTFGMTVKEYTPAQET